MSRAGRVCLVTLAVAMGAVGVAGLVANLLAPAHFETRTAEILFLCNPMVLAVLGGFLALRVPDNPVGRLFLLAGAGITVDVPAKAVLNLRLGGPDGWPMRWAAWVDNVTWVATYLAVGLVLLWFPNGRLLSSRWRPVQWGIVVGCALLLVACLAAPTNDTYPDVRTPAPQTPLARLPDADVGILFPAIAVLIAAAAVSLFLRAARSRRAGDVVTSAQIRWFAWGAAMAITAMALSDVIRQVDHGFLAVQVAGVLDEGGPYLLFGAMVVAITRHGLYEIDRIVSRTVTYALVTGLLLGTYVGLIAGVSALLPSTVNSVVVAGATLTVAALFVPVRRRVQRSVDRRFNRTRHDHALMVERFADQLRHDDGLGVESALVGVVHRAFEPTHAGLWLVPR